MPFREGIDDEKHAYFRNWDNYKYCSGRMEWAIKKARPLPFFREDYSFLTNCYSRAKS